jgi:L-iditol 2-dehydrogenase
MKAAIYKGIERIEVKDIDKPVVDDDSAIVRINTVGICGTDLKTFKRGHPMFKPPCILGHEFVGTVEEVGNELSTDLIGKTYVIAPYLECGKCDLCLKEKPEHCKNKVWVEGAMTEYLKVPKELMLRGAIEIPENVDEKTATLTEPLACAIHGIERVDPKSEERILIIGAGPMGLLLAITLRNRGCQVTIVEINDKRLNIIKENDFEAINGKKTSIPSLIENKGKFDHAILATDASSVVPDLLKSINPGGKLQLFGGMSKATRLEIDPYYIHYKEIDLIGSFGFSERHFKTAFDEIVSDVSSYSKLITEEKNLNEIKKAFSAAMKSENIKVVVNVSIT